MADRQVVARTQQQIALARVDAAPRAVREPVVQAARLRAVAAVGRAAAAKRRERAGPRIAHADGPVAERLDLDAGGRHGRDLVHRELAAAGDTGDAELPGGQERAGRGMHARLGRQVNLDVAPQTTTRLGDGPRSATITASAPASRTIRRQRDRLVQLVIAHEDVEGDVQASAAAMTQAGQRCAARRASRSVAAARALKAPAPCRRHRRRRRRPPRAPRRTRPAQATPVNARPWQTSAFPRAASGGVAPPI